MIYDYENREIRFESPEEKLDYEKHMSQYGPSTGVSHPDDCSYCAERGWKTFHETSFEAECDKWKEEHPENTKK